MEIVIFKLRETSYAIPTEKVLEVVEGAPITPIPFVPNYVDGLVNLAGQILIQIDLALLLGRDEAIDASQGVLLKIVSQGYLYALHVDKVQVLTEIAAEEIHPFNAIAIEDAVTDDEQESQQRDQLETSEDSLSSHFVMGEFNWQQSNILLLDPDSLCISGLHALTHDGSHEGMLGSVEKQTDESQQILNTHHYLMITIGEEFYAFQLEKVLEVIEIEQLTPLPYAPQEVAGIISLRGSPYLTLSLSKLLNNANNHDANSQYLVFVERDGNRYALMVDKITGIRIFHNDQLSEINEVQGEFDGYLTLDKTHMAGVINIEQLLNEQRLQKYRQFVSTQQDQEQTQQIEYRSLLSFWVGEELCALPLGLIDKVVEYSPYENIPEEDDSLLAGIVQVQGQVVPVIDMRVQFNLSQKINVYSSYIIVLIEDNYWALLVDRVNRVVDIEESAIEQVSGNHDEFIDSIGRLDDSLFSIISTEPFCETVN